MHIIIETVFTERGTLATEKGNILVHPEWYGDLELNVEVAIDRAYGFIEAMYPDSSFDSDYELHQAAIS